MPAAPDLPILIQLPPREGSKLCLDRGVQAPALFPGSLLRLRGCPLARPPCGAVGQHDARWEPAPKAGAGTQAKGEERARGTRGAAEDGPAAHRGCWSPKETGWRPPTHPSSPVNSNWGRTQVGPQGRERRRGHQPRLHGKSTSCTVCRSARRRETPPSSRVNRTPHTHYAAQRRASTRQPSVVSPAGGDPEQEKGTVPPRHGWKSSWSYGGAQSHQCPPSSAREGARKGWVWKVGAACLHQRRFCEG